MMRRQTAVAWSSLLLFFGALGLVPRVAHAVSCSTTKAHITSDAEQEFLRRHYDQATTLYQAELQKTPNDPSAVSGLVEVLLRQQKIAEADTLVTAANAQNKNSAALLTALGEVQYREGTPWLAAQTIDKAFATDPCDAQTHLIRARLLRLNSEYASAARELAMAHALDPHNPAVQWSWLQTLPLAERISSLEAYLASDTGDDEQDTARAKRYLEELKKELAEPHKACRLVSNTAATEIPFAPIMRDAQHIRAYGLDVKLNDRNARLQIDTGASGLVITRSIADRAHLERFASIKVGGIGSKGERESYSAYVDSIKIGGLEFHSCQVEVVDKLGLLEIDGLIGMDVLSSFLVTLDFPLRKLVIGELPKRPEDSVQDKPTLQTSQDADDDEEEASKPSEKDVADAKPAETRTTLRRVRGPHDRYIAPEMKDWTRIYRTGHDLIIPTLLNDKATKLFILDTGAFTTSISPTVARQVTKVHSGSNVRVRGVSGEVDNIFTAEDIEFKFGNLKQKASEVVAFETPSISRNTGMEIAGFIGATTLGQLAMSIDYRDGLVKFAYESGRGYKYPGLP